MSGSSTSPMASNLFMKRRRAYVACGNCRRRKVKCVTPSEIDYKPCTRCSQKGLKCEYFPELGDEPSLGPITPPANNQPSSHYPEKSCSPPPITPPSAGISEYLNSTSRSAHRGTVPPSKSSARYPPHLTPHPAVTSSAAPNGAWTQQPTPQNFAAMQQHSNSASAVAPQYYPNAIPYMGNSAQQQQYAQYAPQASGMVSSWLPCVCPPGPCYCGANFNSGY